ncbi:hypothetical protein ACJJIQ_02040 [Microbulbifer sp. ANSA003]|uniref:hypothetical protein n=1 Tax=Microbulbifer sp. ANSA003 TaxID=3243360 RepID=UPI0040417FB8
MIKELQKNTVYEVIDLAPKDWINISVNIEIDEIDGEIVLSPSGSVLVPDGDKELDLGIDATDCFEELRQSMADVDSGNRAWTICDLNISNDGEFEFGFAYSTPPRLSMLK